MNIHKKLLDTSIKFSWHEFNAQHAFMRDEGDRYDAELAAICYQLSIQLCLIEPYLIKRNLKKLLMLYENCYG